MALDNFYALEDGNYLNDIKIFDNNTYSDYGDGFYNFSGMMMGETVKQAKLEFSHIQKHIYEPSTITPLEGVDGHFISVSYTHLTLPTNREV